MEYPGSHFTKKIRLAVLIGFIAAFFVISPILILYTSGYRYDWTNGLFRSTGAINVDIEPVNTQLYLNEVKINGKIPYRLQNVAPGKYRLRLTADGYYDWAKEIEVKDNQTVYIKEIILLKKKAPEYISSNLTNKLLMAPSGRYLAYAVAKNNLQEIWLYDTGATRENIVTRLADPAEPDLVWAKNNNFFAISQTNGKTNFLTLVNADAPETQIDLTKEVPTPILKFQWKDSVTPEIIFSTKDALYSFFPTTGQLTKISANKYLDWSLEANSLWTLQKNDENGLSIYKDTLGFASEFFPADLNNLPPLDPAYKFLDASGNTVILQKSETAEVRIVSADKQYKISADNYRLSKYQNWRIFWSPWEIFTYSAGEEPFLLNRSGEQLRDVVPLDEFNTLGLVWADKTTVLFPYYFVSHDLIKHSLAAAAANPDSRKLYFVSKIGDKEGLWSMEY